MSVAAAEAGAHSMRARYLQLGVLVLASGAIYPLLYLRQNFEVSMLEAFAISNTQLGQCYSVLGVLFFLSYLPSGWLADRFTPRTLLTFSLAMTGLLGIWYWTLPPFWALQVIFAAWGITTGLTFWAALIKETNLIAGPNQQGRFFGILEGGRGVVEAVLGSIVVAWFAWSLTHLDASTPDALRQVIAVYVVVLLLMAPLTWFALDDMNHDERQDHPASRAQGFVDDLKVVLAKEQVWLAAFCIVCGYALFYATYSFAGFVQTELGLTAVMAGWVTVGRLWMRPIGGILAGFIGDRYRVDRVLSIFLVLCGLGLAGMLLLPRGGALVLSLLVVLTVSLLTYAVRGIYWGTLEDCDVPARARGLAIGIISLIGYSPEIWVPLVNGYFLDTYPGREGYAYFYGSMALLGLLGGLAGYRLVRISTPVDRATTATR
jgi:sugar phosphate permease